MFVTTNYNTDAFTGFGHLFPNRVLQMPQTCRIFHRTRSPIYSLEANRLLPRRLHHVQERRGTDWRISHETKWSQQTRFGFRSRYRIPRRTLPIERNQQVSNEIDDDGLKSGSGSSRRRRRRTNQFQIFLCSWNIYMSSIPLTTRPQSILSQYTTHMEWFWQRNEVGWPLPTSNITNKCHETKPENNVSF